ncbi:MAG TPA: segregation/condensation protein A [Actinomycetota bacterium]|nr:segregation/condensation protein A [Actinomycetota bacterium]
MSFAVHLSVFEGPLDLLLQLVSKDRVDVADVTIATITEDFLRAVDALDTIDLDGASSFLVLAATLLELKSVKLLPHEEADPETAALLEERDRLLQRLVEYATFKAASEALSQVLDANEGYFTRAGGVPEELRPALPDLLEGVTLERFWKVAAKVFAPRVAQPVDTSFIAPMRVSVAEMVEVLAEELRRRRFTSFRDLCGESASRADVVVRFLALLELFRQQCVQVEQPGPFDGITVRWRQPRLGAERRGDPEEPR